MTSRVTAVGFQYGIAALRKKRAELDGDINALTLELRDRRRELAKIDDVLRILEPSVDPTSIAAKKPIRYLNIFRQGELGRLIVGLLRAAKGPMTNLEIAKAVMERGGYRSHLWTAIRRRSRANLAYLEAQGRVLRSGKGANASWQLAY